jgi:hypothetical protein
MLENRSPRRSAGTAITSPASGPATANIKEGFSVRRRRSHLNKGAKRPKSEWHWNEVWWSDIHPISTRHKKMSQFMYPLFVMSWLREIYRTLPQFRAQER